MVRLLCSFGVRYRKNTRYGGALASINYQKQKRIIQTASHYTLQYHAPQAQARFDVIAIHHAYELQWLRNAFEAY